MAIHLNQITSRWDRALAQNERWKHLVSCHSKQKKIQNLSLMAVYWLDIWNNGSWVPFKNDIHQISSPASHDPDNSILFWPPSYTCSHAWVPKVCLLVHVQSFCFPPNVPTWAHHYPSVVFKWPIPKIPKGQNFHFKSFLLLHFGSKAKTLNVKFKVIYFCCSTIDITTTLAISQKWNDK